MQIKTTVRYHFTPITVAYYLKKKKWGWETSFGEDVEKLEPSILGMENGAAAVENSLAVRQKGRITICTSNSTPRYFPQSIESRDSNRYLSTNLHSIIHNSQR